MRFSLGIPDALAGAALPRRLVWLTGARVLLLAILLGSLGVRASLDAFTPRAALFTLASSFVLAGVYAAILRSGRFVERLADVQLVFDQLAWTVLAYLSGGASSGAVSLYGLSCAVGAFLTGFRGASIAALSAVAFYATLVISLDQGWLLPPPDQPIEAYRWTATELRYHAIVNILVIGVVMLLSGTLAERLTKTGGQLQAAEERAEQAERMAALGRLAAGLAHEIRNPLGSISGSIQLLRDSPALAEEDKQLCEIIQRESARLNDLVTDMMDLSRPRRPNLRPMDLAVTAREVVELASSFGRSVSDVRVVYLGLPHAEVVADGAQLRQLVWNLVRNGVQASSAGDEVRVRLEEDQDGYLLSVEDDGLGIDEAAKAQLFDAFFTTRSKGTGVGLAVVKRIVDEHGFEITVDSAEGRGARFQVRTPRAPDSGAV
ncbi:MAG: two-component sensor histidine kinase [Polyangiaceae bacterium]|nr:two-component sensor histidine kinase [Polyangiaceae bacterium]MCW5790741.1 two-component sensor histidine kinase [Polyangiaceae bacterium]